MVMEDNESCRSRSVNDTSSSPAQSHSRQQRFKLKVYNEVLHFFAASKTPITKRRISLASTMSFGPTLIAFPLGDLPAAIVEDVEIAVAAARLAITRNKGQDWASTP